MILIQRLTEWIVKEPSGDELGRVYANGSDLPSLGDQVLVQYQETEYTVIVKSVQMRVAVLDEEFNFLNIPGSASVFWVITTSLIS